MSIWSFLFGRGTEPPPRLRNRPNGMAWVKGLDGADGEYLLNGRAVRTVSLRPDGKWLIEPPQQFTVQSRTFYVYLGITANAGDTATSIAIADRCLEPWKEDGVRDSEVRDLYSPNPFKTKETV